MKSGVDARVSGGFSLDEVAALYRRSAAGSPAPCPSCGGRMTEVVSARPRGNVWMVHCEGCGRSVVFDRAPALPRASGPSGG